MEKRILCGEQVSLLGFGAMRLPVNSDGTVDRIKSRQLVDYAYSHGINYFDTAYVYHQGESEELLGEVLEKYPRNSYYLATKTPGHLINPDYEPREIFERQLRRCKTDYFDFYLLHNVMESSLATYTDKNLRVMEYLLDLKAKGRVKHVGISSHGQIGMIEKYFEEFGKDIEFIQLQINYLDWTLQHAKEKYEFAVNSGIPIVVMEPCRGGRLAKLDDKSEKELRKIKPCDSSASWAFRFVGGLDNVSTVLSGMGTMEQLVKNIKTFDKFSPLSNDEHIALEKVSKRMLDIVPCTSCRYCCDGCPAKLDIPYLINLYNDAKAGNSMMSGMALLALDDSRKPTACISCGSCNKVCPQHIDIPALLKDFAEIVACGPDWVKISKERIRTDRK